ncbi:MAG: VWA domain-containing protein [Akkermansiaceae bacterium]
MSFLYPAWFAALIIIPLILLAAIIMRRNRTKVWSAFVSHQHRSELVTQDKPIRFWIALACSLLGLACIIIAMSRPYAGKSVSREKIQSRNILIAMDTSLSMLCEDVQPNRLSSGVAFAVNLIDSLPDDHIGIMAFAGSPNVITSLSIDHPSIIEELAHLGPGSAHIAGSNLKDALYLGINTLKRAGKQANALVLITDGSETLDEIDEITSIAKESYVQIFTIGVGTTAGGTIPVNGEPHRDTQQKVVITKLQDNVLRQLARDTSGAYTHINTQPEKAIAEAIQSMNQYEKQGREVEIPRELYQWFLAPGIFLLILSALLNTRFKSSIPAILLVSFFTTSSPSRADESSWLNVMNTEYLTRPAQIKAGYSALNQKQYLQALGHLTIARNGTKGDQHAKLSLSIAQAAYRLGEYGIATQEYSQALVSSEPKIQNMAQYNLANTLYKQHTAKLNVPAEQSLPHYLEDQIRNAKLTNASLDNIEEGLGNAVTHYSDLLNLNPNHTSAKSNKQASEQVIKAIKDARKKIAEEKKQQQKQEKEDPKEKEPEPENKDDKKQGDQPKQNPDKNEQGDQKGDQKEDQKGPENKQDENSNNKDPENKTNPGEGEKGDQGDRPPEQKSPPKEEQPEDNGEPEKENQNNQDTNQPQNNQNTPDSENPAEFNSKKEALDFLKKHSDTRKKPLTNRRGYYNRPAIDW